MGFLCKLLMTLMQSSTTVCDEKSSQTEGNGQNLVSYSFFSKQSIASLHKFSDSVCRLGMHSANQTSSPLAKMGVWHTVDLLELLNYSDFFQVPRVCLEKWGGD